MLVWVIDNNHNNCALNKDNTFCDRTGDNVPGKGISLSGQ